MFDRLVKEREALDVILRLGRHSVLGGVDFEKPLIYRLGQQIAELDYSRRLDIIPNHGKVQRLLEHSVDNDLVEDIELDVAWLYKHSQLKSKTIGSRVAVKAAETILSAFPEDITEIYSTLDEVKRILPVDPLRPEQIPGFSESVEIALKDLDWAKEYSFPLIASFVTVDSMVYSNWDETLAGSVISTNWATAENFSQMIVKLNFLNLNTSDVEDLKAIVDEAFSRNVVDKATRFPERYIWIPRINNSFSTVISYMTQEVQCYKTSTSDKCELIKRYQTGVRELWKIASEEVYWLGQRTFEDKFQLIWD